MVRDGLPADGAGDVGQPRGDPRRASRGVFLGRVGSRRLRARDRRRSACTPPARRHACAASAIRRRSSWTRSRGSRSRFFRCTRSCRPEPQSSGSAPMLSAFLLFRVLDVWKPGPIGALERLPRGWGIMADDLLAGAVAGAFVGSRSTRDPMIEETLRGLRAIVRENVPLSARTTLRIGGPARFFVEVHDVDALAALLEASRDGRASGPRAREGLEPSRAGCGLPRSRLHARGRLPGDADRAAGRRRGRRRVAHVARRGDAEGRPVRAREPLGHPVVARRSRADQRGVLRLRDLRGPRRGRPRLDSGRAPDGACLGDSARLPLDRALRNGRRRLQASRCASSRSRRSRSPRASTR